MHILSVGLHYKSAPVQIREKFAFKEEMLGEALTQLRHTKSILECVILSTCNRTEVYAVVDQLHTGRHFIKTFLSDWFDVRREEFVDYLDIRENNRAIRHLFEVAVGLDSMVLGETQILGQVKESFEIAQQGETTGTIFNTLFKQVITLAKKAHSETEIGQHAVSVSYAAVELGKKIHGHLGRKSVLILGAGKMSELTAKHLHAKGVSEVMVVNRTLERAKELASRFDGQAFSYDDLKACLRHVDIVISSTGSPEYVLTKEMVEDSMQNRQDHPLFFIDIAVPRDLDPRIHDVENAFLYDIDDLEGIVQANLEERQKAAERIQVMIDSEIDEFQRWLHTLGVVPIITALRHKAIGIQEETMQSILNKLPELDKREIKVLRKHTKSIVNQLMRDPILRIKEMAAEPNAKKSMDIFTEIFALEEELAEQEKIEKAKALADNIVKEDKENQKDFAKPELPVHL